MSEIKKKLKTDEKNKVKNSQPKRKKNKISTDEDNISVKIKKCKIVNEKSSIQTLKNNNLENIINKNNNKNNVQKKKNSVNKKTTRILQSKNGTDKNKLLKNTCKNKSKVNNKKNNKQENGRVKLSKKKLQK